MIIERAKLQLPVVTSGCTLVHHKDGENIFSMSLNKTGRDDRKLQFNAFNWHYRAIIRQKVNKTQKRPLGAPYTLSMHFRHGKRENINRKEHVQPKFFFI